MKERRCPECQSPLESGALDGLCPRCLAGLLFDPGPEPESDSGVVEKRVTSPPMSTRSVLLELPGYEVTRELARGGMGIVYQATQLEPRRDVALKMLLPHQLEAEEFRERFLLEARAIARLEHPHILPVYQVGEHDGVPYFTMKLAAGGSLAERRSRYRRSWREIAELVAILADAVQYAHERGVLHRDLKPGNVLFDDKGRPYVSDFGLAKLADDTMPEEEPGQLIGTPRYVAPEVAGQGAELATVASDIYGLGVILYELLAQKAPFAALSQQALLRMVADAPPPPPGTELRGVPHELDILCMRCLEKNPSRRFRTAGELSAELTRWLRGEPIESLPATRREQFMRWVRQQRAVVGLTLGIAVLGLVLVVGSVWVALSLAASRKAVVAERDRARGDLVQARLGEARGLRLSGQIRVRDRAMQLLAAAAQADPKVELRDEAAAILGMWEVGPEEARHRHAGDGLPLALSGGLDLVADVSLQGEIRIWRRATGTVLWRFRDATGEKPEMLRFSVGGRWLAVGMGRRLRVVDVGAATVVMEEAGRFLGFSADERWVVLLGAGRRIELREPGEAVPTHAWELPEGLQGGLAVSDAPGIPDVLAVGRENLAILSGTTGEILHRLPFHRGEVRSVAWHDGWVAAGDHTGGMRVWNLHGGRLRDLAGHRGPVTRLVMSPDGSLMWSVAADGESRMWDLRTGNLMAKTELWQPLGFRQDGLRLAYLDGSFFGVSSMLPPVGLRSISLRGSGEVRHVEYSPDGGWMVAVERSGVWLLDPITGGTIDRVEVAGSIAAHFASDGSRLAVVHRLGVQVFRIVRVGRGIRLIAGEDLRPERSMWLMGTSLEGDGRGVLIPARSGDMHRFDLETMRWDWGFPGVKGGRSVTTDPDRRWMALDFSEGRTEVKTVGEGKVVWSSEGGSGTSRFSPDGRHLLLAGGEWHRVLDTVEWKPRLAWETGSGPLTPGTGQWSRYGRAFAASTLRSGVVLGSTESWKPVIRLNPPVPVLSVAFSPDAKALAAGTDDDQVLLWSLPEVRQALGLVGRQWTETIHLKRGMSDPGRGLVLGERRAIPAQRMRIMQRAWEVSDAVIDLGAVLNEPFDDPDSHYRAPRERPIGFPVGRVQLERREFEFRGWVRVGGDRASGDDMRWPLKTEMVGVGRRVRGLVQVGAMAPTEASGGVADGNRMRVEWEDGVAREWSLDESGTGFGSWYEGVEGAAPANRIWEGISERSEIRQKVVRLYRHDWVNPRPEVMVRGISWMGSGKGPGMRVAAVTVY